MIKNIVFDIGLVMVEFEWKKVLRNLGLDEEKVEYVGQRTIYSEFWNDLDEGIIDEDIVLDAMCRQLNHEYDEVVYKLFENLYEAVKCYDYSVPWVKELKAKGYNVYALSNYPRSLYKTTHDELHKFLDEMDGYVISAHVKKLKPHRDVYEHLLKTYNLKPEETLFFDDKPENIEGACKLGINGHLFKGYEEAKEYLKSLES